MRRKWHLSIPCTHAGCGHVARYEYDTLRDLEQSFELRNKATYKCVRHSKGDGALSPENLKNVWVSEPLREESYGKYFGNNGVLIGQGFYVAAKDFPVGTLVRVTCEVLLP